MVRYGPCSRAVQCKERKEVVKKSKVERYVGGGRTKFFVS